MHKQHPQHPQHRTRAIRLALAPGVPGPLESGDGFGPQLLASDVNGDGRADLTAIAAQEDDPAGAAWHLPGATFGSALTG